MSLKQTVEEAARNGHLNVEEIKPMEFRVVLNGLSDKDTRIIFNEEVAIKKTTQLRLENMSPEAVKQVVEKLLPNLTQLELVKLPLEALSCVHNLLNECDESNIIKVTVNSKLFKPFEDLNREKQSRMFQDSPLASLSSFANRRRSSAGLRDDTGLRDDSSCLHESIRAWNLS